MRDLVKESFPKIEQLFEHKRLITGVPTGFVDLDAMTRGFQAGDLVIIAARPSMGKTSLVLNIAQHVALQPDHTVGVFSLEMSKESLFLRLLTSEAQIDSHRLMSGAIGQKDYGAISHALETLSAMRLFIDDTAGIGVLEMRAKSRRLQAEHGLSLLVVDYIQLMSGRGRFENRTLELASISRSLKGLAKELNVPIVVLSQLSRAPEARSDHRPQLSDLRESGALEQDADVVILIYREDAYNRDPNHPDAGTAELISPSSATVRPASCGSRSCASRRDSPISLPGAWMCRSDCRVHIDLDDPQHGRARRPRGAAVELPRDPAISRGCSAARPRRRAARHHRRRQSQRLRPRRRARGARARAGGRDDAGVRRHRRRHRAAARRA